MLANSSLWRKVALMIVVSSGIVWLYEVTALDSRFATMGGDVEAAPPAPGARLLFSATAYCKGTTTASGAGIQTGIAAADPDLLPVGSVVRVEGLSARYNGIYTILDTGPRVKGRQIDVYMWSCNEALAFGRRSIRIQVMRLGWNPRTSTPERVGTEFRRREAEMTADAPARPSASAPPAPPVPTPQP